MIYRHKLSGSNSVITLVLITALHQHVPSVPVKVQDPHIKYPNPMDRTNGEAPSRVLSPSSRGRGPRAPLRRRAAIDGPQAHESRQTAPVRRRSSLSGPDPCAFNRPRPQCRWLRLEAKSMMPGSIAHSPHRPGRRHVTLPGKSCPHP